MKNYIDQKKSMQETDSVSLDDMNIPIRVTI